MLVEIPDPGILLGIVLAFLGGLVTLYLYTKLRRAGSMERFNPSNFDRVDFYEKQLIDMKIRMDAMELEGESYTKPHLGKKTELALEKRISNNHKPRFTPKPTAKTRTPNMSFENSVEHVLGLITKSPMTSRDIEVTFSGRSREHVSRLMKKLFRDGYVNRNTASRPYTYMITEKGRERISSKENIQYVVSQ
jgi:predicted transcriptional regulator